MSDPARPDTPTSSTSRVLEDGQGAEAGLTRARLSGVLRAASHSSIISTDLGGVIRVFNAGAEHMLGYAADELIGKAKPDVFHLASEVEVYARELSARLGRPVEGFDALVAQLRQGGPEAYDAREWTYVRKDGRHVPVLLTITGVYSDAGELEGFLGVGLDLTERRALEAGLHKAQVSVDNAGDMILWGTLAEGRCVYANQAACDLLGYRHDELVGMTILELNPLRTQENWHAHGQRLRTSGRYTLETVLRRKDGLMLPVESTSTLVEHGGVEYSLGIIRDISARKALEADLRQAQVSMDNSSDMIIWATAEDGRYTYANEAVTRQLGYSRQELLAMSVFDLNPRRTPENWQETVSLLRREPQTTWQGEYRTRSGRLLPVEFVASLIRHEGQDFIMAIIRDISERRALEADLRQAQVGVDTMQDMLFWTRVADRRIAYANRAACETLGYTRDELLGLDVREINPARNSENWQAVHSNLRSMSQMRFEAEYRRKDGTFLPVETRASLIVHEGVEYAVGLVRDITERRAAEERLRSEIELNSSLAEAARALIGPEPNLDGISGFILERARELTQSEHGYVGFVDQQTAALHPGSMTAMMQGGGCEMADARRVCPANKDGSYPALWGYSLNTLEGFFDNNPAAHPSAGGLPAGHVPLRRFLSVPARVKGRLVGQIALANSVRDYTSADLAAVEALADVLALGAEQLHARRELLAAKEAAESSSRAKSGFLANMTHEVRTPLNGILGMLQVLLTAGLTEEQRDYANVALDSAERLHLLLGNVLEYARLDSGQGESECLDFPPTDLLHSLAAVYEPLVRAKGLGFTSEAAPDLPELMRGDPQALRQALTKLLDNALKFTASGHVRLSLAVEPAELPDAPQRLVFRVEDTGIGIPADKRERVFEAFVQADASFTRSYGGAGLGLAIARRQVERLGGSVSTAERPGGGTVMTLTVPANCPPHPAA